MSLRIVLLLALSLPLNAQTMNLLEARKGFTTQLVRLEREGVPPDEPPSGLFELVRYPAPLGANAAYLSSDPQDGRRHPAVIWLVGGFSNSIGEIAWMPGPRENDQSAAGFRDKGIVMLYPSLRGGNENPGTKEGFFGEVDDVLAAADFLAKCPYVDPARIYLGGHSTGGTLALLVAASAPPGRFRAIISFGPSHAVASYGQEVLPFDVENEQEAQLREPQRWLGAIQCLTHVFEGTNRNSNIASLRSLQRHCQNPLVRFHPMKGGTHFSIIRPLVEELAGCIADDGADRVTFLYPRTGAE